MLEQNHNIFDEFDKRREKKSKERRKKKERRRKTKNEKKKKIKQPRKQRGSEVYFGENNACFTNEFFDGYPFQKYDNITKTT